MAITFIMVLTQVLLLAVFARAILSWFPIGTQRDNPIVAMLYQITEPMLAPLRSILPRPGMMDFSPMVAILILIVIQRVVARL